MAGAVPFIVICPKLIKISDGLQNKIKKAKNEIENLNEISRQISMSLDFDIVFAGIFDYLRSTYGFEGCCLTLVSPDKTKCKNEKFVATDVFESLVDSYLGACYSLSTSKGPIVQCILKKEIEIYQYKNIFEDSEDLHPIKTAFLMPIRFSSFFIKPVNIFSAVIFENSMNFN